MGEMKRRSVSSGSYLEPILGFTRAVRVGPHIAVAGTAPIAAEGGTTGKGDVYAQTIRCLEIIEKSVIDAGGARSDIVRTRILLTNIADWKEAGRAHGEYFGDIRPATTVMQVTTFVDPDWLVELEADAIVIGD